MVISNITLIGMPFSGKSTCGKLLAEKLGYIFIDLDNYIEEKYNMSLSNIVLNHGNNDFLKIEEDCMLEMSGCKNIFSTGGSVIYSEKGMNHLKNISKVLFLDVSINNLMVRMNSSMENRGIVFKDGQTFEDLFLEREPLYKKFADIIIKNDSDNPNDVITKILQLG